MGCIREWRLDPNSRLLLRRHDPISMSRRGVKISNGWRFELDSKRAMSRRRSSILTLASDRSVSKVVHRVRRRSRCCITIGRRDAAESDSAFVLNAGPLRPMIDDVGDVDDRKPRIDPTTLPLILFSFMICSSSCAFNFWLSARSFSSTLCSCSSEVKRASSSSCANLTATRSDSPE